MQTSALPLGYRATRVDELQLYTMRKAILHLKKSDPVMKAIIEAVGPYKLELRPPCFDTLVRSIVFQQVSGNVARVILGRLREVAGEELTPEGILLHETERLRKCGLSRAKTEYIQDLARRTQSGEVDFATLPGASDEEVIASLVRVKGIGVWTAQMFLMFALERTDVLPTGDLGVRKAMQISYQLEQLPTPDEMREIAAPWQPYRSVASWYLWRSLDGIAAL